MKDTNKQILAKLNQIDNKLDKLDKPLYNKDFERHPAWYTLDDCMGGILVVALIIGGIIAVGLFFHFALP